jgi:hypothetical protein
MGFDEVGRAERAIAARQPFHESGGILLQNLDDLDSAVSQPYEDAALRTAGVAGGGGDGI